MTTNVELTPGRYEQELKFNQYDSGTEFKICLFDNEEPYQPHGAAVFHGTKPSGLGFTLNGTIDGPFVIFETEEELTQEPGYFPAEVQIKDGDAIIGTANVTVSVEASPHPYGTTDGTKEEVVTEITALVNRAETAANNAEAAAAEITGLEVEAVTLPAGSEAQVHYNDGFMSFGIPAGQPGQDGEDGAPGFSPIATVEKDGNTTTITITDAEGTTTEEVTDGTDGQPGEAATIQVGTVTSGNTPAVTNSGTSHAAVFDFVLVPGPQGQAGPAGPQGPAYVLTAEDKAAITQEVLAQMIDAETEGM